MNHRTRAAVTVGRVAPLLLALLWAAACKGKGGESDAEAQPQVAAQTVVVTPQPFTETLGAIGTVTPRPGHVAALSAPAAGRIGSVEVAPGQVVKKGQMLVQLDQAPFEAARQSADAALAAAEKAAARQQQLADEGIVPRKDAETAKADEAKARSDAVAARRAEALSTLRSPIDGVVTHLAATLGMTADPSQPLVEVSDPAATDILLSVTPSDAARLRVGMRVTLSAGRGEGGEALGVGELRDLSGTVDTTTRSVPIRVRPPVGSRGLRIGETIYGSIAVATRKSIVVPNDAVVPEGETFKVFVVDSAGIAHEHEVKIGARTSTSVEILEGLSPGDRVVTFGAYGLEDSAKVVPLTPAGPKPKAGASTKAGAKPDSGDKP